MKPPATAEATAPGTAPEPSTARGRTNAKADVPAVSADPREADLSPEERDYLFDIRGYRIIKGALSADQIQRINGWIDSQDIDALEPGQWIGDVQTHTYGAKDGINFQNVIEGGDVFEECIDHPSWFEQCKRYIDQGAHRISIDENFLNIRRSGGFIPVHSGGPLVRFTSNFRNHAGKWAVGQINILMALTDVHVGDGCTTLIPGSHKAHEHHPANHGEGGGGAWARGFSGADVVGMVQAHLDAGDALMFTDAIMHGSLPRTNDGERRVMIYRYAPHLLAKRFNYLPSPELMSRLTPQRKQLVYPTAPRFRPGRTISAEEFEYDPIGG